MMKEFFRKHGEDIVFILVVSLLISARFTVKQYYQNKEEVETFSEEVYISLEDEQDYYYDIPDEMIVREYISSELGLDVYGYEILDDRTDDENIRFMIYDSEGNLHRVRSINRDYYKSYLF